MAVAAGAASQGGGAAARRLRALLLTRPQDAVHPGYVGKVDAAQRVRRIQARQLDLARGLAGELLRGNLAAGKAHHHAVGYRGHPRQEPWHASPVDRWDAPHDLDAALAEHDTAAGYLTSALVVAGLRGLHLIAMHPGRIAARWRADGRERWAHAVAWANWAETEIGSGAAIDWLLRTEQEPADPAAAC